MLMQDVGGQVGRTGVMEAPQEAVTKVEGHCFRVTVTSLLGQDPSASGFNFPRNPGAATASRLGGG